MGLPAGFLLIGAGLVAMILLAGKGLAAVTGGGTGSGSLPGGARSQLNARQQTFASELARQTGLDPGVISAWVLAEEGGQSTAPNGANNWLNIGATEGGFFGAGNPAWGDPAQAADFTAQWLRGTVAPGFGAASAGIRGILSTVGQSAQAQISALQNSGWASDGYPNLPGLYRQVTG